MIRFLKGYRTLIFHFTLLIIGIVQKLELPIPNNVVLVTHELLHAVGIQNVDGSTLIGVGMAGIMLRIGTDTPVMRR